jgi:hypothetical protein
MRKWAATWPRRTTPADIDRAYRWGQSLFGSESNPDRAAQSVQLSGNITPEAAPSVFALSASSAALALFQEGERRAGW